VPLFVGFDEGGIQLGKFALLRGKIRIAPVQIVQAGDGPFQFTVVVNRPRTHTAEEFVRIVWRQSAVLLACSLFPGVLIVFLAKLV
jgi:hypothetical protein